MKKGLVIGLLVIVLLGIPQPALACDAWICLGEIFGWTEVADRDAQKEETIAEFGVEIARIKSDSSEKIAAITSLANVAESQNETIRAQAYALARVDIAQIEADRELAILQTNLQYQAWLKQVEASQNHGLTAGDWLAALLAIIILLPPVIYLLNRSQRQPEALAKSTALWQVVQPVEDEGEEGIFAWRQKERQQ